MREHTRESAAPSGTQSVCRALDLLTTLGGDNGPVAVGELSQRLGLHASTVSRLLGALEAYDFVVQDEQTQRFQLGPRCLQLGQVFLSQVEVADVAEPLMRDFSRETGLQCHLAVLRAGRVIHVKHTYPQGYVPTQPPAERYAVGEVYSEALGKVLLAFQPDEVMSEIVAGTAFVRHTAKTIMSRKQLLDEVQCVRRRGFAVDDGELVKGIRCVAVPIWNHLHELAASLSVSGSDRRVTTRRVESLAARLHDVARSVSERIGVSPATRYA